jgi:TolA-binding protein
MVFFSASAAFGQTETGGDGPDQSGLPSDITARRKLENAKELLAVHENDRAVKLLESILEGYPDDPVRFQVYLVLGRQLVEEKRYGEAVGYLQRLNTLEKPDEAPVGEEREMLLEGLYLTGLALFQQRQFERAFPVLRRITSGYPHTAWANQAYYYIGMSHFALGSWNKAVEALSLVGTSIDPNSPAVEYVEAGRRFYVKIADGDLPVLHRLGKEVSVSVETAHGDKELLACVPLPGKADLFIGSLPTEVGVAKPGDHAIQVTSGDAITSTYLDDNTQSGEKDVPRAATVKVVSTAQLGFTTGTYENSAPAAFIRQPLFVAVLDADCDSTPNADRLTVKVTSRYKAGEEPGTGDGGLGTGEGTVGSSSPQPQAPGTEGAGLGTPDSGQQYRVRDEALVTLEELPASIAAGPSPQAPAPSAKSPVPAVRTGRFGGKIQIEPALENEPVNTKDGAIACAVGDEIVALYVDERHIGGSSAREVKARITVSGELENRPRAELYIVTDPLLRAKKNVVEATAFLELARIFKSMGLNDGAKAKADEGLGLAEAVVRATDRLPGALREKAFELKWELELSKDDFAAALATCEVFGKLFPNSPLADAALLGMGRARLESKQYTEAVTIFARLLAMPQSLAKAEAQFRIAEATEAAAAAGAGSTAGHGAVVAIQQYRLCADRYPTSEFAGPALAKIVDYYIRSKDFAQADDLLEQVFTDHPDAKFLDSMLLKWAIVAFRREDFAKAQQKLNQLVLEYPESKYAEEARKLLPQIEARLQK